MTSSEAWAIDPLGPRYALLAVLLSHPQAPTAPPRASPWGGAFMASLAHVGRAVLGGSVPWASIDSRQQPPPATRPRSKHSQTRRTRSSKTPPGLREPRRHLLHDLRIRRLPDGDVARRCRLEMLFCMEREAERHMVRFDSQHRRRPTPSTSSRGRTSHVLKTRAALLPVPLGPVRC